MMKSIDSSDYTPSPLDDSEGASKRINVLRSSMAGLEEQIMDIAKSMVPDEMKMARLRKIQNDIKNEMNVLHSSLIPDITA